MEALIEITQALEKTTKVQGDIIQLLDQLRKKVEECEITVAMMNKRIDKMQYAEC